MIYTMKFFWNGVKVNGVNKIIPVKAYADDNGARILYNWEWSKEFYADLLEVVSVKFSAALPLMIALYKAMKDDDNNEKEG